MSFVVVMFLKTKEVEAVPKSWLIDDDGRKYCFWPNFKKIEEVYAAAKIQATPDRKNWKRFAVRCFQDFDSYDLAVKEIAYFLIHSDYVAQESSKESAVTKNSRKLSHLRYEASSAGSSDSEESPAEIAKRYTFTAVDPPLPPTPVASTSKYIPRTLPANRQTASTMSLDRFSSADHNSTQNVRESSGDLLVLSEIRDLKFICTRNFATVKLQQEQLSAALENINSKISALMDGPKVRNVEPQKFGFPFKTQTEFLEFEEKVKVDQEFRQSAVLALSRVGGEDLSEVTNNIFRKLMQDEVCKEFTLYGTAEKQSFVKLETFSLIIDAVRNVKATSGATESSTKKTIMTWLQHSVDRIKARQQAAAKRLAQ